MHRVCIHRIMEGASGRVGMGEGMGIIRIMGIMGGMADSSSSITVEAGLEGITVGMVVGGGGKSGDRGIAWLMDIIRWR